MPLAWGHTARNGPALLTPSLHPSGTDAPRLPGRQSRGQNRSGWGETVGPSHIVGRSCGNPGISNVQADMSDRLSPTASHPKGLEAGEASLSQRRGGLRPPRAMSRSCLRQRGGPLAGGAACRFLAPEVSRASPSSTQERGAVTRAGSRLGDPSLLRVRLEAVP